MKIIHCADFHIDSKSFGRFSPEKRDLKRNQLLQNFVDMVKFAENNKVSAILLCGDFFDGTKVLKKSLKVVQDIIISHPNITFFYIWGNHDEKVSLFYKNPNNFVVFGDTFSKIDFGEICVGGISYSREINPQLYDSIDFQKSDFNILMMHCPVINNDKYSEAVQLKNLEGKFVDYLALGHIHKKVEGKIDRRGIWSFSGCVESDSFSYLGNDYGFYVLDIVDKTLKRSFVSFSKFNYQIEEIKLSKISDFNSLTKIVEQALSKFGSDDIVKVVFTGVRKEEDDLNLNFVLEKYKNKFFYLETEDQSKVEFDLKKYANEKLSLKAEFIKEVMMDESLTEDEKQKVCMAGLEALKGEDISL